MAVMLDLDHPNPANHYLREVPRHEVPDGHREAFEEYVEDLTSRTRRLCEEGKIRC